MKIFLPLVICAAILVIPLKGFAQKTLKASKAVINFYSHTPVEDIEAKSEKVLAVLNTGTNQLAFALTNTTFQFPNSLMQDHFNEKYMESDKFPKSTFSGKINEIVNWTQNGEYKVTITGKLNVHGTEKLRTIPATISIKDNKITALSEFLIKTEEHKIEIPKLVWEKIAEEIKVNVNAEFPVQ